MLGVAIGLIALIVWPIIVSTKTQVWAQETIEAGKPKKGQADVALTFEDVGGNRWAMKLGGYRVGYLQFANGVWIAQTLRGKPVMQGSDKLDTARAYAKSLEGGLQPGVVS